MQASPICGIHTILYTGGNYPWKTLQLVKFTGFILFICFDIVECLFLGDWNVNGIAESFSCRAKAEEGDKNTFVFLAYWAKLNHFIHYSGVITLITILSGASLADSLGHVIAGWMGTKQHLGSWSFLSLAFLIPYSRSIFGELYPKRIAMWELERWVGSSNSSDCHFIRKLSALCLLSFLQHRPTWAASRWSLTMCGWKDDQRWNRVYADQ